MARGQLSEVGATRVAANGYHYTKTEDGWRLTHHLTMEKKLGRPLTDDESVRFVEPKFKKDPYNPEGLYLIKTKTSSLRSRLARLEDRRREIDAEITYIKKQLHEE